MLVVAGVLFMGRSNDHVSRAGARRAIAVAAAPRAITVAPIANASPSWGLRWTPVGAAEPHGHSAATPSSVSADGRYVVFASAADDIVEGDLPRCDDTRDRGLPAGCWDVFVHDRLLHRTAMASVNARGRMIARDARSPMISADGRKLAFVVSRRGPNDPRVAAQQILVKDLITGSESVVTRAVDGSYANAASTLCSISGNGRYVAFTSYAWNLAPAHDYNGTLGGYVRDTLRRRTISVSDYADGRAAFAESCPSLAGDGSAIAFWSSERLTAGDTDDDADVYVRDLRTNALDLVPVVAPPFPAHVAAVSWDGNLVAFYEGAAGTDRGASPDQQLFFWDRAQRRRSLVAATCSYDETDFLGPLYTCPQGLAWSQDGGFLAFEAGTPSTRNAAGSKAVYRFELSSRRIDLVSVNRAGAAADHSSTLAGMSRDGYVVVFVSSAFNIVRGESRGMHCHVAWSASACSDVFVRDLRMHTTERASARRRGET
jgi:Tol biopolymer transport system component